MTVFVVVEVVELEDLDLTVLALPGEDHVDDPDEPGIDQVLHLRCGDAGKPVAGVFENEQFDGSERHRGPPTGLCSRNSPWFRTATASAASKRGRGASAQQYGRPPDPAAGPSGVPAPSTDGCADHCGARPPSRR